MQINVYVETSECMVISGSLFYCTQAAKHVFD